MIQPYFHAQARAAGEEAGGRPQQDDQGQVHRASREEVTTTASVHRGRDADSREPRPRAAHRRCAHRRGRGARGPGGELVGIIGPNGAGKTSLFNLLSGLVLHRREGGARRSGHHVAFAEPSPKAGLGRTFQVLSVFPRTQRPGERAPRGRGAQGGRSGSGAGQRASDRLSTGPHGRSSESGSVTGRPGPPACSPTGTNEARARDGAGK